MTKTGIGLKPRHGAELLATLPPLGFLEIHAENYMGDGGPPHRQLESLREHYPLSVHGVGLSLGSDEPLDDDHLDALAALVARTRPMLVSEHLAWCRIDGTFLNDLLPLPYTKATLALMTEHVDQLQSRLGRTVLIENPSTYVAFAQSTMSEGQFLTELTRRTGCGLLLDINNLYVSARNLGLDSDAALDAIPAEAVDQYHLAGHCVRQVGDFEIRIDDHGSRTGAKVWTLYQKALDRIGHRPTLIEWDTGIPDLSVLVEEAAHADSLQAGPSSPALRDAGEGARVPAPHDTSEPDRPYHIQHQMRDYALDRIDSSLLAPLFRDDHPLNTAERLGIHRNNTMLSLTEALAAAYPVLCRLVGENFFAGMAAGYIRSYPPRDSALIHYGSEVPAYIGSYGAADSLPYLADVARLELSWRHAYLASEAIPIAPEALSVLPPESLERAILRPHPSLRFVASSYPIDTIWHANQPDSLDHRVDLGEGGVNLLVFRPDAEVRIVRLGAGAFAFVMASATGQNLVTAWETALSMDADFQLAPELATLLANCLFVGVDLR